MVLLWARHTGGGKVFGDRQNSRQTQATEENGEAFSNPREGKRKSIIFYNNISASGCLAAPNPSFMALFFGWLLLLRGGAVDAFFLSFLYPSFPWWMTPSVAEAAAREPHQNSISVCERRGNCAIIPPLFLGSWLHYKRTNEGENFLPQLLQSPRRRLQSRRRLLIAIVLWGE